MPDYSEHVALDLFAGSGVGAAVQQLGAREYGVEQMPEAQETRRLNGLETIYDNVWDAEKVEGLGFDTLWASPPCQLYSVAGKGAGRKALDDVLGTLAAGKYEDMAGLREWAISLGDERIGLVLSPLHYIWRYRPEYVALEQVPTVLPVWEAYRREMEAWGYSSWAGYLHSEQYGVPQTRKRAFLLAKRDPEWIAGPPRPTHSKYYSRSPEKLDPGVKKWVSMAEALGGVVHRPSPTVTGGQHDGRLGAARERRQGGDSQGFVVVSNYGSGGDPAARGRRMSDQPSATITSKFDRMKKEAA